MIDWSGMKRMWFSVDQASFMGKPIGGVPDSFRVKVDGREIVLCGTFDGESTARLRKVLGERGYVFLDMGDKLIKQRCFLQSMCLAHREYDPNEATFVTEEPVKLFVCV